MAIATSSGSQSPGGAKLAAVPPAAPSSDFDLGNLTEGVGQAREVPPSPRLKDLKKIQGWVDERVAALERRLKALRGAETRSKLGEATKKYGIEVLEEELRILQELNLHYARQREEAGFEHAELNRIEFMISGDTVPNSK